MSWSLDPARRRSSFTADASVNGAASWSKVNHYGSDSDEPGWIVEDTTAPSNVTRYVPGVEGDIAVTTSATGGRVVQVVDLHGDVTMTIPLADGASVATWTALKVSASDEFGLPLAVVRECSVAMTTPATR
jgi:hypothetical protein